MAKKKRSEIEEEENKKRSKIGAFLHKWRKWIVFGGIALGGVGLSFLTLGVSALLPALASIFSIVGIVTAAITALGVLLFGGNLLVNAVRFIFNIKNYRTNLLNARRERKAARERERETERERGREADNERGKEEENSRADTPEEPAKDLENPVEETPEVSPETENPVEETPEVSPETENPVEETPEESPETENPVEETPEEPTETENPVEETPETNDPEPTGRKSGGYKDLLDEEGNREYSRMIRKRNTDLFAGLTPTQVTYLGNLYKSALEQGVEIVNSGGKLDEEDMKNYAAVYTLYKKAKNYAKKINTPETSKGYDDKTDEEVADIARELIEKVKAPAGKKKKSNSGR